MRISIERLPRPGRCGTTWPVLCLAVVLGGLLLPCSALAAPDTGGGTTGSGGAVAVGATGGGSTGGATGGATGSATGGSAQPATRSFDRTIEQDLAPEQARDAAAVFPATITIEEEGFSGEIPLVNVSLSPLYSSETGQADRTRVFDGLPDNDVSLIPTSATFEVSSDEAPGATRTVELQRAEVSYEVTGTDASGIPDSYRATVVYRGAESVLFVDGYHATATYEGELAQASTDTALTAEAPKPAMSTHEEVIAPEIAPESAAMGPLSRFLHNGGAWILVIGLGVLVASTVLAVTLGRGHRGQRGERGGLRHV